MSQLRATLLGRFGLATADGQAIPLKTRKARALFALLVMGKGQPIRREWLASLLWSRTSTRQSLASLSQALYSLRQAIDEVSPGFITAQTDSVFVDPDLIAVDVWDLEANAADDSHDSAQRCLDLYRGEFLDDLAIDTEDQYSEWRASERVRLESLAAEAGTALMAYWDHGPQSADMTLVGRLLALDPYNEPALRVRMRLLALSGRPAAAIEAADKFADLLSSDLGIVPSDALADLVQRIRAGDYDGDPVPTTGARPSIRPVRSGRVILSVAIPLCALLLWIAMARYPQPDTDIVRLLVRPFEAGEGVTPDLAEGFSDDLATELVRRTSLDIISRESGRLVADGEDASSGASHVLRGRLRTEGTRWVLNVWLNEVESGQEVWADRFVGAADTPRDVRDDIVRSISEGVGLTLTPLPGTAAFSLPDEAVPDYLGALSRLHAATPEANAEAILQFTHLAETYPDAIEVVAGLVIAFERVAFEADDFARTADLHWLEGYLLLKRALANTDAEHPDLLAARARLALRRLDFERARALAQRALEIEDAHVAALAVLAQSLALSGDTDEARRLAARAVSLSPATSEEGYLALALSALADGDLEMAHEATDTALETARGQPLQLLALSAAILGLTADEADARVAFEDLISAMESRPFAAWRVGETVFTNPRAMTWQRPTGREAFVLIHFVDETANARFQRGIILASGHPPPPDAGSTAYLVSDMELEDLLLNREIVGRPFWPVPEEWRQVRTVNGTLFQDGAFGPLPGAQEGQSSFIGGRVCDRWVWEGTEIENCQLVVRDPEQTEFFLIGETGWYPFAIENAAPITGQ